jgi:hypothetical protein
MVNQGKDRYEAISERLASEARDILLQRAGKVGDGGLEDKSELMTLFGGLLMFVQFKVSSVDSRVLSLTWRRRVGMPRGCLGI